MNETHSEENIFKERTLTSWVFQMMILSGFFYLKKDIHMISEVTFLQTDSLLYNED